MPAQYNMLSDVRSFMQSRVILTAAELDLFTKLDQNAISAKDLAAMLDLNERALTRILDCLITFELLKKQKNPQLQSVIYDLAGVIAIAEEKIREVQLQNRVSFVAGDYNKDKLPKGCDLALLSAVIHQNSPKQNLSLFQKIYDSLEIGGRLLIRDHVMDTNRTSPPMGALFALNMLVSTSGGDTYTFAEIKDGLKTAGFEKVEMLMQGERMDCLVEARKK